ncbi:MAG TPA: TrkH family potassium uptake protein [Kiritimatiellia bacterium]|nr:TrkH family potassium uptake protein [Kiritimatiellia bacterium]
MNFRAVFHLISFLPLVLGLSMLVCWGVGAYHEDSLAAQRGFALSAAISLVLGSILWTFTRGTVDLNRRDGVGIVTFGWLLCTLLGAIPFMMTGAIPHPADAWFESVSGFTTTGASVMTALDAAPRSVLLWRAMSQFFGGMGILVLCVAILPLLGSGGMQIYRAEAAGPSKDRLTPRIANTAKLLWAVYVGLAIVLLGLLYGMGMSGFDAVCHALSTVATGGFSTRDASIAAFQNPAIEWTIIVFMFLGGINFALHWRLLRGDWGAWVRDAEWRLYAGVILLAIVIIGINTGSASYDDFWTGLRGIAFSVVSVITTTGFGTDDFAQWPALSQYVLLLLMFLGGCAGSTAGGIKMIRVLVLLKQVSREMKLFIQPQGIFHVKIGRQVVEPEIVSMISAFFIIFILLFIGAAGAMMFFVPDLKTAVSAVASALGNIGPGLGEVGPASTYAFIPTGGKIILAHCMLLGRLELYTMLVVLIPGFWRR